MSLRSSPFVVSLLFAAGEADAATVAYAASVHPFAFRGSHVVTVVSGVCGMANPLLLAVPAVDSGCLSTVVAAGVS